MLGLDFFYESTALIYSRVLTFKSRFFVDTAEARHASAVLSIGHKMKMFKLVCQ